jgi:hypothetical protein
MGDDIILGNMIQSVEQAAGALDNPDALTSGPQVVPSQETDPVVEVETEVPAIETDVPAQAPEAEDGDPRPAPRAWMTRPPTLAFAGESLGIELAMTERLQPELVDAVLDGVELKRLEFEVDPPIVRLMVSALPGKQSEGTATWSFRLATADGRLTEVIEGSCQVLH